MKNAVRIIAALAASAACLCASAQDSNRKEMKRADLSGAPGMEVVLSTVEVKPGEAVVLHLHHGIEAGYVLEGGKIQAPGKDPMDMATGSPIFNLRDAAHGGWKNVGTKPIKLLTVHIVDKGKPLYDEKVK